MQCVCVSVSESESECVCMCVCVCKMTKDLPYLIIELSLVDVYVVCV